jgi:hypothetical protein
MKTTSNPAPCDFAGWEKRLPRLPVVERDDYIIQACKARKVFHLGAADSPMTRDKAKRGELLHQKLAPHCGSLIGFDLDGAAIKCLRDDYDIQSIFWCDLENRIPEDHGKAEVLISGDLIEHVNSAGSLMQACNRLLKPDGLMVLTTINALSIKQAFRAFLGREPVHPDHVAYYSFATLGVLGQRYGFELVDCRFFAYPCVSSLTGRLFRALYRIAPGAADGICVIYKKVHQL